jgi:hypothetical protein
MKLKLFLAGAALFGAFAVTGPLQHIGVLPQTAVGDASKAMIKTALNITSKPALAACGNNGFGNGALDGVPGNSGFTDITR